METPVRIVWPSDVLVTPKMSRMKSHYQGGLAPVCDDDVVWVRSDAVSSGDELGHGALDFFNPARRSVRSWVL